MPSVNFLPRMIFGTWLWPLRRRQLRSRLAAHVGCKRTGTITSTMSCEQAPRAIESANLDRSTVDVRSRELLVPVFPFVWQRVSDLFWAQEFLLLWSVASRDEKDSDL